MSSVAWTIEGPQIAISGSGQHKPPARYRAPRVQEGSFWLSGKEKPGPDYGEDGGTDNQPGGKGGDSLLPEPKLPSAIIATG